MIDPDFEDFMLEGGFDLIFLDDEVQCPYCDRIIESNERVEWIDKSKRVLKCHDCGAPIETN